MWYGQTGEQINRTVKVYKRGLVSIQEALQRIETGIENHISMIPDTDKRIEQENRLYKYALRKLLDNFRD